MICVYIYISNITYVYIVVIIFDHLLQPPTSAKIMSIGNVQKSGAPKKCI